MSELVSPQAEQQRIEAMASSVGRIIENPFVIAVLQGSDGVEGLGWGLVEYRAGEGLLGDRPSHVDQEPAEITFYAKVPSIGVDGTIFWHGPESQARKYNGELFGIYLDPELEDGSYTHYHQVRQHAEGRLEIGVPDPEGSHDLLPPDKSKLRNLELKLSALFGYVEGVTKALK